MSDGRETWGAPERNKGPILDVLQRTLPERGLLLEIASGTGQHVAHFAAALPSLRFQPSERDAAMHASIAAWTAALDNVLPPIALDVTAPEWPLPTVDAIFNANMIHIAPFVVCEALMRGAGEHLAPDGTLVMYGPYRIDGRHTSESNAAFDASLRERDPEWGVRDLEIVCELAGSHGLSLQERVAMPANNQTLIFRRS
jgi:SAM-dependent methyltransferase